MKPLTEDSAGLSLAEPRHLEARSPRAAGARRRGRPLDMPPEDVLARIRQLAARETGLFRVHLTDAPLYARARRLFGSWGGAVRAAGFDYLEVLEGSRRRAVMARRAARRSARPARAAGRGAR